MNAVAAQHLLGAAGEGQLILLAGPNYGRIIRLVDESGIASMEAYEVVDVDLLRAQVEMSRQSLVVTASMCEVEGRLDRSSFDRRLLDLAYAAHRVVYSGLDGAVTVWPEQAGASVRIENSSLRVSQHLDVVA